MQPQVGISWIALVSLGLAALMCGWWLRHLWGLQTDRDHARRMAALCDRLDAKDFALQALRQELQAARQALVPLEARPHAAGGADRAVPRASNESTVPLAPHIRAPEGQAVQTVQYRRRR